VVGSVLLADAVVEKGAVVQRSIVGAGARVGRGAEVCGLSVLGDGYVVEAGSHLDGARLPASAP
jgi:mannose-1-phosphate guanylyltransferase